MTTRAWMALGLSTALLAIGSDGRADEPDTSRNASLPGKASLTADGELIVSLGADQPEGAGGEAERGMIGLKAAANHRLQFVFRLPGRKPVFFFVEPLADRRLRVINERGGSENLECSMLTINLPADSRPESGERPREQGGGAVERAGKTPGQDEKDALGDAIAEASLDVELSQVEVDGLHQRVLVALQNVMACEDREAERSNADSEGRREAMEAREAALVKLERVRKTYLEKGKDLRRHMRRLAELQERPATPRDPRRR